MSSKRIRKQMVKMRKLGMNEADLLRIREISKKEAANVEKHATERAFLYMLAIPLNVLAADYWPKSAKKRTHKYIKSVLSLYAAVQEGIVSEQELAEFLDDMAGIKVEAAWMTAKMARGVDTDTTTAEALRELENLTVDYGNRSEAEISRLDRAIDMAKKALREAGRREEK